MTAKTTQELRKEVREAEDRCYELERQERDRSERLVLELQLMALRQKQTVLERNLKA